MTQVRIGRKVYRNIEGLSVGTLEQLIQTVNSEIVKYEKMVKNYPVLQKIFNGEQHLKRLLFTRNIVKEALVNKK